MGIVRGHYAMDRNTVIRAIENCIDKPKCRDCPWETCERDHERVEMPLDLVQQALGMLKQEPVEPTWRRGMAFCSKCGRQFGRGYKYCPDCGSEVKWE